jgi:hypothetical protein
MNLKRVVVVVEGLLSSCLAVVHACPLVVVVLLHPSADQLVASHVPVAASSEVQGLQHHAQDH